MRDLLKIAAVGLLMLFAGTDGAVAQCGTTAPANKFCGNDTGSSALATWKSISAGVLSPIAAGSVLGNPTGATAAPSATRAPVLGLAGTAAGSLGFQNATSGTVTLQPVTGALGTVAIGIPGTAGTMAVAATSPLALSSTTGTLTCATCVTSSGGGAISGTAPVAVSAAGVVSITGQAGGVLAGSGPAFTRTPVLGVAGSVVGSVGFQNATSGTITLSPVTGALGSVTLSLPAATDTLVGKATTDTFTNKTYNAQGTGNVFQLDGVTVTGKAAASDYFAGTSTAKLISPSVIYQAPTTTTFGTTITFDFATFIDTGVVLTNNITTQTLNNVTVGKAGTIAFTQDATGNRTTVWNTIFKFAGGVTPTLSTAGNAVDILSFSCRSSTFCQASLMKDVK